MCVLACVCVCLCVIMRVHSCISVDVGVCNKIEWYEAGIGIDFVGN